MKKILIDYGKRFVRTVLLEDGEPGEIVAEDRHNESLAGRIYAGIVTNILPSGFAFVDIGGTQNAFLNLNDKKERLLYTKGTLGLKRGASILVQVVKDAAGTKAPAVTTQLNFTGGLCVVYPVEDGKREIGISLKITAPEERERLKKAAGGVLMSGFGVIVRTEAGQVAEETLVREIGSLTEAYRRCQALGSYARPPALVYSERPVLCELMANDVEDILINDADELPKIREVVRGYGYTGSVTLYTGELPLFDAYDVEKKIKRALNKRVWLDCGGFLVIEQTEACAVIDVNTGKYKGKKDLRATVEKTNMEAAHEIAKQIRLRNLSGIIIIDFIAMERKEDVRALYDVLSEAVKKDRIKTNVVGMTELGLMQLTRKKMREPIGRILLADCEVCHGTGHLARS